jgi:TetR/AcrR family transcriptional regulator
MAAKTRTKKPKKRGPSADRGETQRRILEAADTLLGEVGYEAASAKAVADRAEVNKALVFYYFGSKPKLFERVLERYYDAHRKVLTDAAKIAGDPRERLHGVVDAYLDFIDRNNRYPRLVQQLVAGSTAQHALIEKNIGPLFELITSMLADVTPDSGELAARHFFVTFSGMVINYFTYAPVLAAVWGDDPLSGEGLAERRRHVHWMVDALLDGLARET